MAQMAKPDAEPLEEYDEYVLDGHGGNWLSSFILWEAQVADVSCLRYESLPPNFSLIQNMAAGAFAGIAVRFFQSPESYNSILMDFVGTYGDVPDRCNQGILGLPLG